MGKRGPAPKAQQKINWTEFENLVSMQCTQKEIASWFKVSVDTLERAYFNEFNEKLADLWDKRKLMGKVRLRKIQFEIAEKMGPGAATMAIWLGKQILGQRDQPEIDPTSENSTSNETKKTEVRTFEEFCAQANYFPPFPKQIEMKDFIIAGGAIRLLLGARGYGKTDYCTIMGVAYEIYCAWKEGNDLDLFTNLILTKSKARCGAIIQEISDALEKNGVPLDKSNSSVIRVQGLVGQDHSVEAITIKTSMRGRHPKRIIMDDPVTDEDVSEAMRVLVKKKYEEAAKLCTNIAIIGQPAHAYDLYAELRGIVPCMEVPHGTIPELDADLDAQRLAGISEASIQASYHLKIMADGTMPFQNIKYLDKFPNGDSVAFIDPSDGGDHTAISVIKGHFDGIAVQGHQWKKAWYHCLDEIVHVLKVRGVRRICFETNATGTQPLDQLRQVLGPLGIGVVGVHSDTNKHATIMQAGSYAERIYLSKESERTYTDHVVKYEYKAKFDDAPDSLARGLQWLGLIRGKK